MKKRMNRIVCAIIVFSVSCSAGSVKKPAGEPVGTFSSTDQSKINGLMKALEVYNAGAPETLYAKLYVFAQFKNKKYKSYGTALYDKKADKMSITFVDYIFKSPLTKIFQTGDILKFYFPVDKKLFIDNRQTIDLSMYSGMSMDYSFLHDMAVSKIPLIKDHKAYKIFEDTKNSNNIFLVLENEKYFETISFKGKRVDKILLVNKATRGKYEIYIDKYAKVNNRLYFKKLRFVNTREQVNLRIEVTRYNPNKKVRVKIMNENRLSRDVKVIRM